MIKKCLDLLKNNPSIITFYVIYELVLVLIILFLFPTNFNQILDYESFDFVAYYRMMMRLLVAGGLSFLISILFMPGFGHMLSEAVVQGKTSARSFLEGINRFFVRFLLLTLLSIAAAFAFSMIISTITVPITLMQVIGGGTSGLEYLSLFVVILIMIISMLIMPFVLLCIPSLLIDDVRLFQGIKNGAKAGVKNYWKLLVLLFIMYLPAILYQIIFYDDLLQGTIITPGYIILLLICGIISLFIIPILFIVYKEYRMEQLNNETML